MTSWLRSIDQKLHELDSRVTVMETILSMIGAPIKGFKGPKADP